MFAIDTNLLVYAHNEDSAFHKKAAEFLERVMNEYDADGNLTVCFPAQVFHEFINVITRQTLRKPLSLEEAIDVVQDYLDSGIHVVSPKETQIQTWLQLLRTVTTRKKIFDVALVMGGSPSVKGSLSSLLCPDGTHAPVSSRNNTFATSFGRSRCETHVGVHVLDLINGAPI